MTPFGFSKPTMKAEEELMALNTGSDDCWQWAEFNPGDRFPTIVLKWNEFSLEKKEL